VPIRLIDLLMLTATLGDVISPSSNVAPHRTHLTIRRRFQFSSALKRMSTLSSLPNGKIIAAVKGAPETIKGMLDVVPENYDHTYKWFTRKGSRVLALGMKGMEPMNADKVRTPLLNQFHTINGNYLRSTNFQETKSKANLFSRVFLSSIVLSRLMPLRLSKCLRIHLIG
jgi:magnesium-transporting ATPase (P-type)